MTVLAWALAALPLTALAMTVINAVTWRRGAPGARFPGELSVLVPARNEADGIEAAVRAIARSRHPIAEIVVYDDASTDGTADVLRRLSREIPMLRVIRGGTLPAGWVGKPHACHRLAASARGDVLVFLDADVALEADGLERLASLAVGGVDIVTASPRQVTNTAFERLVVPFLLLTYVSWLPLELVARVRDARVVAANGQVLVVSRAALEQIGGFGTIRSEIVDDVAFCRRAKEAGLRVAFADGTRVASCRMYRSAREVWDGFSKNIHEGVGGSRALVAVLAIYATAFFLPYALMVVAAFGAAPALLAPATVGVLANVAQRGLLAARWRQPFWGMLDHPAGALAVIAIGLNSLRWSLRGKILWAGRSYGARDDRQRAA